MKKFLIVGLVVAMALAFVACDDGSDNGGGYSNSGGGNSNGIKGTSWERKSAETGSISSYNYTDTITFTTEDTLTIKVVGWYEIREQHVNGYNVSYTTKRTNVNDTYTGTYTYFSNTKEGFMNSTYWNINPWNFRVLSDGRTLAGLLDTNQFTKR